MGVVLSDCHRTGQPDACEESAGRYRLLEDRMEHLFHLHDLNANGTLEEVELVKLNEKIAILHRGVDVDRRAVRKRYTGIFRDKLDPNGKPIGYSRFREYMLEILDGLDPDEATQAMILDRLIVEADLALAAFPTSLKVRPGQLSALPSISRATGLQCMSRTTISPRSVHGGCSARAALPGKSEIMFALGCGARVS